MTRQKQHLYNRECGTAGQNHAQPSCIHKNAFENVQVQEKHSFSHRR